MQAKVALKKASALSLLDISICDSYLLHIWSQGSGVRGSDGGGGGIDREDNVFFFRDGEGAASVGVGSFCWSFVGWPGLGKGEKEKISCHGDSNTIVYSELGT
jgi:hypothetical protein